MGVPAFFRWLSLRYPRICQDCVEEVGWTADGEEITIDASRPNPNAVEFDNLYLDMNGIIHPCTHPEDRPAPTTEEEMFVEVWRYTMRIMNIVRPRKLVYMAIDGVAPRAKINQQRSRRFRAAQEAVEKAQEEDTLRREWKEAGMDVPNREEGATRFDSNVITPGTPFMERLAEELKRYTSKLVNEDAAWRNVKVIFSDASVAGEGEHKIAEFVRQIRAQEGYDGNTKHVLYGLDADLIMLGLATHELHFSILRELVMLPNGKMVSRSEEAPKATPGADAVAANAEICGTLSELGGKKPFQFLHVHLLREYLDMEFRGDLEDGFRHVAAQKRSAPRKYDFERVVDDFVFMCFFVGNDFLPHLPSLDIRDGAIDYLIELYKSLVPEIGYMTDGYGNVDLRQAIQVLQRVGSIEDEVFRRNAENEKREQERRQKMGRNDRRQSSDSGVAGSTRKRSSESAANVEELRAVGQERFDRFDNQKAEASQDAANAMAADMLRRKLNAAVESTGDDVEKRRAELAEKMKELQHLPATEKLAKFDEMLSSTMKEKNTIDEPDDDIRLGERGWKERYYEKKFGWDLSTDADLEKKQELCKSYMEGLLWVMRYYYRGCVSWTWYFPYHYAPFASDLAELNMSSEDVEFDIGESFTPLEQLMSVLPAASAKGVLPDSYVKLMVDQESPIAHYYPVDFDVDLNGKKFAWQGVALLPFVDEKRLREALAPIQETLSVDERRRNQRGISLAFSSHSDAIHRQLSLRKASSEPEATRGIEAGVELELLGPELTDSVFFGTVVLANAAAFDTVEYRLPHPTKTHDPRPVPSAQLAPPSITDAEFSAVRAGRTGWKPARFGALGMSARHLREERQRRRAGNKGQHGNSNAAYYATNLRDRDPSLPYAKMPRANYSGHSNAGRVPDGHGFTGGGALSGATAAAMRAGTTPVDDAQAAQLQAWAALFEQNPAAAVAVAAAMNTSGAAGTLGMAEQPPPHNLGGGPSYTPNGVGFVQPVYNHLQGASAQAPTYPAGSGNIPTHPAYAAQHVLGQANLSAAGGTNASQHGQQDPRHAQSSGYGYGMPAPPPHGGHQQVQQHPGAFPRSNAYGHQPAYREHLEGNSWQVFRGNRGRSAAYGSNTRSEVGPQGFHSLHNSRRSAGGPNFGQSGSRRGQSEHNTGGYRNHTSSFSRPYGDPRSSSGNR